MAGARRLNLGGRRQHIVLAMLLLDANRPVTTTRLTEAIYDEEIPPTGRAQVQICVSALRRLFADAGSPDLISTVSPGYVIHVPDSAIDVNRFEEHIRQARAAQQDGRTVEAVEQYRAGLAEWRGPAFDGLDSRLLRTVADRFTERWVTTAEDCLQLDLDIGRHREMVEELAALVAEHPLRERLRGQLMLALYRSGRQSEALQVYQQTRRTLQDELGIEPNEWLRRLHSAILNADQSLDAPDDRAGTLIAVAEPAPAEPRGDIRPATHRAAQPPAPSMVPRMLPTDIDDFTGRTKHIDSIQQQLLLAFGDPNRRAVPIIVLEGKPGIGKTTIAVHASHGVADLFPDGQLFADVHGNRPDLVTPMKVLERFLRVLGVPGNAMPDSLEERAEIYRSMLAGRKILVVLDDADSESDILPLLPGNPESAVVITSRRRLYGVAGADHINVDVLEPDQSVNLLARIVGSYRIAAEPRAALELARLCGQLPLALRIAGARLAAHPQWSVEQFVLRLEDETRRLDELTHGGMAIRAGISFAYESVSPAAGTLFRRLAILDAGSFSGWMSAALLDRAPTESQDLLDDLAEAQLVEVTNRGMGLHSQYRLHDLIRVFARERLAAEESTAERSAALKRVLGALLFMVEQAHRREYGGNYVQVHSPAPRWPLPAEFVARLIDEPLAWYERERVTLIAAVRQAAAAGFVDLCWDLAVSTVTLFESRMYVDDWRETHEIALAEARKAGDVRGTAAVLYSMGSLHLTQQRYDEALREFETAISLFRQAGDAYGAALTMRNLAFVDRMNGDTDRATEHYERALAVFRDRDDPVAAAYVLHNLAQLRLDAGDLDEAQTLLDEALSLTRTGDSRRVQAQVLHRMGETDLRRGDPVHAVAVFEQALLMARARGDRTGEVYTLHGLGMAHLASGRLAEAETTLHEAADVAAEMGERMAQARTLLGLGECAMARGDVAGAIRHGTEALRLFRAISVPVHEAAARRLLDEAYAARDAFGGVRHG